MTDAERHVESLAVIDSADVRAAFIYLLIEAERSGLTTSGNSGHVHAVRMHNRDGQYLFSYIANTRHLLFYLRNPAFETYPSLRAAAQSSAFAMNTNSINEFTTRLHSVEEASEFFSWLKVQIGK